MKNIFDSMREIGNCSMERGRTLIGIVSPLLDKLPDECRQMIDSIIGRVGCTEVLSAADISCRLVAAPILAKHLVDHRERCANSRRTYFHITFCGDDWNVSDRGPIGQVNPLRAKVYRAIKGLNMSAVGVVEVQALMNYPGEGKGRTLMYHAHVVAWSEKPRDPKSLTKALHKTGVWESSLGAAPIKVEVIGDRPEDMAAVAHYLVKPPHSAKNRMPSKKKEGKFLLMDTTKGYRPELALRVLEGLSQIEFMDLVFGVNDGSKVRQALRSELAVWHRSRIKGGVKIDRSFDLWVFWLNFRREHGSKNFLPYRFIGGGLLPKPSALRRHKIKPKRFRPQSAKSRPKSALGRLDRLRLKKYTTWEDDGPSTLRDL